MRMMTRLQRRNGMPLLTLPNEVLVEIAKHLEPHDRSLGALRMLGHNTRFLRVVRHKPTFCLLAPVHYFELSF